MVECKPVSTPMEPGLRLKRNETDLAIMTTFSYQKLISMLFYLLVGTRPDIAYPVNYLCRFVTCYDESHWSAVKRVLQYLKGTSAKGVTYNGLDVKASVLVEYGDANWGSDEVDC